MTTYTIGMSNKNGYLLFTEDNLVGAKIKAAEAAKMLKGTAGTVSISWDNECKTIVGTKPLAVLAGSERELGAAVILLAKRK